MYENNSVLFVDDELNILQAIRRGLIDEEFHFYSAMSGQEALEIMENHKIDLVVTDMRMPEMNGLQLMRVITERWPKTIKIVLTGYTQFTQIITTINQIDIFKFLTKPWQMEELINAIHKALDFFEMQEVNANYKDKLEKQNRTYQILLRKFNDAVSNSKFNTDFLSKCGKALFDYGKDFTHEKQEKYARLFDIRGDVFLKFSAAVTAETSELTSNDLNQCLEEYLDALHPKIRVVTIPDREKKFRIRPKLLEASIGTIFEVFAEEILHSGVTAYLGITKDNLYSVVLQCPLDQGEKGSSPDQAASLDTKIDFLTAILRDPLEMSRIDFQARVLHDSMAVYMKTEEHREKKKK